MSNGSLLFLSRVKYRDQKAMAPSALQATVKARLVLEELMVGQQHRAREERWEGICPHTLSHTQRGQRFTYLSLSTCHWGLICFGPSRCIGYSTGSLLLDLMLAQSRCGSLKGVNGSDGGCSVREMQMVGDTCRRNAMNLSQLYWHHILKTKMDTCTPVYCWHTFGLQQQPSNRTSDHS